MLYWIIFLTISLILAHFSIHHRYEKKIRLIAKYLLLIVVVYFSGFRDGLGQDYNNYYRNLIDGTYLNITYYEPLLGLIANLIYFTNLSPIFFFLFCATITNVCFFKIFYKYENTLIIIFIYLTGTIFYFNTFNLVRQMFAASIFMYSTMYIKERNFFKYLFSILLAASMHISSLFLIPVYFFGNRNFPQYLYIIILFLSILFGQVLIIDLVPILSKLTNLYEHHLTTNVSASSGMLTLFFNLYLILFIIFKRSILVTRNDIIAFNMFYIGVIFYNLVPSFYYIFRFAVYFIVFAPVVLVVSSRIINKHLSNLILIMVFGVLFFLFLYNGIDNIQIVPDKILPLKSIFDH